MKAFSKLKKIDAACAVLALTYVKSIDEEAVLRVCKAHGFTEGGGMYDEEWLAAAKTLEITTRAVALEPCLLGQFLKKHPKGLFLVSTPGHLMVVDNGIIIDPRIPGQGLRRKVVSAWKVVKK